MFQHPIMVFRNARWRAIKIYDRIFLVLKLWYKQKNYINITSKNERCIFLSDDELPILMLYNDAAVLPNVKANNMNQISIIFLSSIYSFCVPNLSYSFENLVSIEFLLPDSWIWLFCLEIWDIFKLDLVIYVFWLILLYWWIINCVLLLLINKLDTKYNNKFITFKY